MPLLVLLGCPICCFRSLLELRQEAKQELGEVMMEEDPLARSMPAVCDLLYL